MPEHYRRLLDLREILHDDIKKGNIEIWDDLKIGKILLDDRPNYKEIEELKKE